MKRIFKMLSLVIVGVIGILGLVIGGVYLFSGFDEKPVYAQELFFNVEEMVSSGTFALEVNTPTENVNKLSLVLETLPGGDGIIEYPRTITIGESFRVAPKKVDGQPGTNEGGYVVLHAKYAGATSNQAVVAKCKILIDVKVEEVSVMMPKKVIQPNEVIQIASVGESLDKLLDVNPLSSLMPYSDRMVFGDVVESSKFSQTNLANKKIFLEVFASDVNPNNEGVSFAVGTSSDDSRLVEVEVEYEFDSASGKFLFTKDIYIKAAQSAHLGEVCLKAYYYPTYSSQKLMTPTNIRETATSTLASQEAFNVIAYSVDSLEMLSSDRTIFLNEDSFFYINNPSNPQSNLGITLKNDHNNQIDPTIYRNSLYISVESQSISYILTKSNGDSTKNAFGLNAYIDGVNEMSQWCWKFNLTDFLAYYNYVSFPTNPDNKVKLNVEYNDGTNPIIKKSFFVIPDIHKVTSLSVKYAPDTTAFNIKSGNSLQLTESNFEYHYTTPPTFTELAYYIPYHSPNQIRTVPTAQGSYDLQFNFTPSVSGAINNLSIQDNWCSISNSSATFTQGSKTFSINYSADGTATSSGEVEFEAGKAISCRINGVVMSQLVSNDAPSLFKVTFGNNVTEDIPAKDVKFFHSGQTIPLLSINDVSYAVNFDYFEKDGERFIHILPSNSTYVLSGIGSFSIVAQLVHTDAKTGIIYWLDGSVELSVYAFTDLTSLSVKHFNTNNQQASFFDRNGILYKENQTEPVNHFFVSCEEDQLDALKKNFEKDKIKVSFVQDFGENVNTGVYEAVSSGYSLSQINASAITFGQWQELLSSNGKFIGYYFPYYINEIHSISIDEGTSFLPNHFNITILVENEVGSDIVADFDFGSGAIGKFLPIEIKDKILDSASLSYPDTNAGTSSSNPIKLTASISNGAFGWNTDTGTNSITNIPVQYSFKYKDDAETTISHMTEELLLEGSGLNNVSAFHTFSLSSSSGLSGSGGLSFANLPYKEDGYLVKLRIFSTNSESEETTHFLWKNGEFVRTINKGLSTGASLYFKLIGLDFDITAENPQDLVGYKDNVFDLFKGDSAIFDLSRLPGLNDLSNFSSIFSVVTSSNLVEVDANQSKLTVKNDLLFDENINLSFIYANADQIYITSQGGETTQSFSQKVNGAFNINLTQQEFLAPSEQPFCTITYKEDNSDAIAGGMIVAVLEEVDNVGNVISSGLFTIEDITLKFKSITGTLSANLRLTLSLAADPTVTTSRIFDISIKSKYEDEDLTVGSLEEGSDVPYVLAGNENEETLLNGGISLGGELFQNKDDITGISLSFEDVDDSPAVAVSKHMKTIEYSEGPNVGFYSTDLNFDKNIKVTFTFTFSDGGTFEVTREILIKQNIDLEIEFENNSIKTGDKLSFGYEKFSLKKENEKENENENGETTIPYEYFFGDDSKYQEGDIVYDQTYFSDITDENDHSNILILQVKQSGGSLTPQTVKTTIFFNYRTEYDYILEFSYSFTLTIENL